MVDSRSLGLPTVTEGMQEDSALLGYESSRRSERCLEIQQPAAKMMNVQAGAWVPLRVAANGNYSLPKAVNAAIPAIPTTRWRLFDLLMDATAISLSEILRRRHVVE